MRILVATGLNAGAAEYKNLGDVAMLQVAVKRLQNLWPDAGVEVLTDSPADLARHCPGAQPISRAASMLLVGNRALLGRLHRSLPRWASNFTAACKWRMDVACPSLLEGIVGLRARLRGGEQRKKFYAFVDALNHADLFAVCGSGGFADSCRGWNLSILGTIEAAMRRDVPVFMFGQGMGPLNDPVVLSRARRVFPRLSFITLRGSEGGLKLLESLGVPPAQVATTGDEAIELAYAERTGAIGFGIGINLRLASYSGVEAELLQQVRFVSQELARSHDAPLIPIPIAHHRVADDTRTIRQLLAGFDDDSDGGLSLDTPSKIIEQTARCRIVVTGAYHAAVFALAQGIPTICLAKSDYYLAKFQGLKKSFGAGCEIIDLSEREFPQKLTVAIEGMWELAEEVRAQLLQAAGRQIAHSREAYQIARRMVESGNQVVPEGGSGIPLNVGTAKEAESAIHIAR